MFATIANLNFAQRMKKPCSLMPNDNEPKSEIEKQSDPSMVGKKH